MGESLDSVVGDGVGVVKRRQLGGYRGVAIVSRSRDDLHCDAPASRTPSASYECEDTSLAARVDWSSSVCHC